MLHYRGEGRGRRTALVLHFMSFLLFSSKPQSSQGPSSLSILVHKHNYLTALSHLLRWIPKQVLMSEIPNVSQTFAGFLLHI